MSRARSLSTTSYATLGLLAVRPWSAYELAGQLRRSLARFWPRATSKLYEEPHKLVEHEYATRHDEQAGRRTRSVFTITDRGRTALQEWLATPADPVVTVEAEPLLRVFLAEFGTREDLLRAIDDVEHWAVQRLADDAVIARAYLDGDGPFPSRLAHLTLVGAFSSDLALAARDWARRTRRVVRTWPADLVDVPVDLDALRAVADRAAPEAASPPPRP